MAEYLNTYFCCYVTNLKENFAVLSFFFSKKVIINQVPTICMYYYLLLRDSRLSRERGKYISDGNII